MPSFVLPRANPPSSSFVQDLPIPTRFIWQFSSLDGNNPRSWTSYHCSSFELSRRLFSSSQWQHVAASNAAGRLAFLRVPHSITPLRFNSQATARPSFYSARPRVATVPTVFSAVDLDNLAAANRRAVAHVGPRMFPLPASGQWVALVFMPLVRSHHDEALESELEDTARQAAPRGVSIVKLNPGSEADVACRKQLGMVEAWGAACLHDGRLGRSSANSQGGEVVSAIDAFLRSSSHAQAGKRRFY